jgi:hypothetical protein
MQEPLDWVAQVSLLRPGLLLADGPDRNRSELQVAEGSSF